MVLIRPGFGPAPPAISLHEKGRRGMQRLIPNRQLLAVFGALLVATGCGSGSSTGTGGESIKIGVINSFTGEFAAYGQYTMNGINMALNEKGNSVQGHPIELVKAEDGCSPEGGATAANKLVGKVVAVIGPICSGSASTAGSIFANNKIPYMADVFLPALTKERGNAWIFRDVPSDAQMQSLLAEDVKNHGFTKIAMANDTSTFGAGEAAAFLDGWKKLGMSSPAVTVTFEYSATDFAGQVEKVKQAGVQAIVVAAYEAPGGLFVKQARQLGLTVPFFGGYSFGNRPFLEVVGDAAEGARFATDFMPSDPEFKAYATKYQSTYNLVADDSSTGAYRAMLALLDAFNRAGPTAGGEKLRDTIRATDIATGVGKAAWDSHGDLRSVYVDIGQITNRQPILDKRALYSGT
jgi:branched-chain amino acid transport system substrate-binding protein